MPPKADKPGSSGSKRASSAKKEEGSEEPVKEAPKPKPVRFRVAGAGSTGWNGVYQQAMGESGEGGTRNGAAFLELVWCDDTFGGGDKSRMLFRDVDTRGAVWWLYPAYKCAAGPDTHVPPEDGWECNVGKPPAPQILRIS
mmetsp:Transcript_40526/g.81188  ORF Transcript_40526/g.81188 Transcript_40526/m.81188 type:complete len:141 (+) Transcript_40526:99-521(+)|eukprot:CAMPEP_0196724568 /NCGR_PEP_ID=MMETSP1091-20130531/6364_1 /TAXON_ID=302021 /ORGANISM="Rhodomonas sp., Strain CCMP768" /LENGTH=140 /DNA_ID=CAMNT_0042066703 /DNA_START=97 /DNA_END=519 /DNA_ORIENTATION=+